MDLTEVPDVVVLRIPIYLRALIQLKALGEIVVSSSQMGDFLQITPAQIRKDLNYFGSFGTQGRGYAVSALCEALQQILGLEGKWPVCVIGAGRLGEAIVNYSDFGPEGFDIVGVFDSDARQIDRRIGSVTVQSMGKLAETIKKHNILIGIVSVPARYTQEVIDELISHGVLGILNYAPVVPQVPDGVVLRNIDPVLALQSMTFYLRQG